MEAELWICRLTPPAPGALAVVHLIGPDAPRLAGLTRPHRLRRRRLGEDVLARWIPAAESLTGRETVEITCHGGPEPVRAVLESFPARRLEWDELLARAPIHETRREAHRLLPFARTVRAARVLSDQAEGALERALAGPLEPLLATAPLGRALVEPRTVVLMGRPNAGKSTLLNALVEAERALTSDEPGTTRDPVRAAAAIDGVPLWFVDTAGIDEPRDALEAEAVARSRRQIARADLVVHVRDTTQPPQRAVGLAVDAKIDLAPARDGIGVCALDGRGIPELRRAMLRALALDGPSAPGAPVVFTARQEQWIRRRLRNGR
jgi:tRNA modification GTPase